MRSASRMIYAAAYEGNGYYIMLAEQVYHAAYAVYHIASAIHHYKIPHRSFLDMRWGFVILVDIIGIGLTE